MTKLVTEESFYISSAGDMMLAAILADVNVMTQGLHI
jgi:hypothetical protein